MGINMARRMQCALLVLRSCTGYNLEQFAKILGITRQYYSELENCKNRVKLTKVMYWAILFHLERKIDQTVIFKNFKNNFLIGDYYWMELSKFIATNRKVNITLSKAKRGIKLILEDLTFDDKDLFIESLSKLVGRKATLSHKKHAL